jgi:hypothetical protein
MVIFQKPNKHLWAMIIAWPISFITYGIVHAIAYSLFVTIGIIWAYEEITQGVNWFRKLLGWSVLIIFIANIVQLIL